MCHALSVATVDAETGEGALSGRGTLDGVPAVHGYDAANGTTKCNSVYFFIGSVLAIAAFAWYFKLRGVTARIEDDMPPIRQRTCSSAFEMHGADGL